MSTMCMVKCARTGTFLLLMRNEMKVEEEEEKYDKNEKNNEKTNKTNDKKKNEKKQKKELGDEEE